MSYRPHGRAEVDPSSPRAFAVCDRCGVWYNHCDLSSQWEWAGQTQIDMGILVCYRCLDDLQPQQRTIILPPDPLPVYQARVELSTIDDD